MKIMPINTSFDDLHIRKNISNSEHQDFWQKILSFEGYPEYGIRLSSSFDNYFKPYADISHKENEALENYVADSWGYINKYLTDNKSPCTPRHMERKIILENIIEKMPLSELNFYRAVKTDGRFFSHLLYTNLKKNLLNPEAL